MAITAAQLVVEVSAEGISETTNALRGMGRTTEEASGHAGGFLQNMMSFAGAQFVVQGVEKAFELVKNSVIDCVTAGMQANDTLAQTTAVLKSTHGAAGVTADHVEALSTKLMNLTGIQDDTISSTQNMLLTFTNIGNKGGVFDTATQTALDMSVALGQDTKSSAIQLGKALNDPVHGITALQRVGVTFNSTQKDLIAGYMKHGDVAKAQGVILQELNKEFGGSAEAAGNANGGIKKLSAQFDNMKQTIGQAIIPIIGKVVAAIEPFVQQLGQWLPGAAKSASDFFQKQLQPVLDKLSAWLSKDGGPMLQKFGDLFVNDVLPSVKQAADFFTTNVLPVLSKLAQFVVTQVLPVWLKFQAFMDAKLMPVLKVLWTVIANNVIPAVEDIWRHVSAKLIPAIERLWAKIAPLLIPILQALGAVFQNVIGPAISGAVDFISTIIDKVSDFISIIQNLLGWLGKVKDSIGNAFSGAGKALHNAHIPGFAGGGTMQETGLAVVGERGPELVALPGGSRITPIGSASSLMSVPHSIGGALGGQVLSSTFVIMLDGKMVAQSTAKHLPGVIRLATGMKL